MITTCPFLVTLTLILLISQRSQSSTVEDKQYAACKPFECGGLTISYPFFDPSKQPSNCGWQRFKVSCNNHSQTIIKLSFDEYVVNNISYQEQYINITNSAFSSPAFRCPSSLHNLALTDARGFNYTDPKLKHILVLQNCSGNMTNSKDHPQIKCNETVIKAPYWAVREEDYQKGEFGECGKQVGVPYYEEGNDSSSSVEEILRKGIVLNYKANDCSHCEESGGRCALDQTTFEYLCLCPDRPHRSSCHPSQGKKLKIILGSVLPGAVLLLIILVFVIVYRRRRKNKSAQSTFSSTIMSFSRATSDLGDESMKGVTVFTYKELEAATEKFDPNKELGEGGFGIVYYGKLKDGREVAVKRLYEKNYKRIEQFKNEIRILTNLRHPNLVTLYGCTTRHSRELLLVYEFIANGTVADHVHGDQTKSELLPWSIRMKIAIETATALSYLHSNDIIHRDVKTNNILLDNNFTVKVADFGLSRLFPADVTHISTAPQGTPGYVDPKYHQCYHLTDKSDVYSFGVVLVELLSSLPAVDVGRHESEINLSNYAMVRIQCCAFGELVDPSLGFQTDFKVRRMTKSVAELAFQCLQPERELRPSMEEVLEALNRIASVDYDALEAEETEMSTSPTQTMKPPPTPSQTDNGDVRLSTNNGQQPASPVSVMDKWVNYSKSTTPETSRSSLSFTAVNCDRSIEG